jgi:cytochrome P450
VRKDMMHFILNARDPQTDRPFSRSDLDAEASLLIAAGADTTSTTLAAALFYLTLPSSSRVLSKLQTELRESFASSADIKSPSITSHTYLRAVIDEVLRLAPPVPTHLPRQVIPNQGLNIDGMTIPRGAIVGVPAYALHHNEQYFPESWAFRPERWIPSNPTTPDRDVADSAEPVGESGLSLRDPAQVQAAREAFAPFSLGSRGCVGRSLAYLELCICLGRLLYTFDIRRAEHSDDIAVRRGHDVRLDEYQLKDRFLADRNGPMIEFKCWSGAPKWLPATTSPRD